MFIRKWERSLHSGGILGLKSVSLWITLPGLPLHLWGEEVLSAICSVLGNPLYADRTTAMKTRLAFARVCVEFSGEKPLLENVSIEDDMVLMYSQKVVYEWKPPQCLKCGVFGHMGCGLHEEELRIPEKISGQNHKVPSDMPKSVSAREPEVDTNDDAVKFSEKKNHAAGTERHEEGWELVRARKKRPIGSGAPYHIHTRPDKQRTKTDGEVVSRSYWAKRNLSLEKVPISEPSLNMEIFSNAQNYGGKDGCPLSSTIVLDGGEGTPGQTFDLLNTEMSPLAAQKSQTSPSPNGENILNFGEGLEKEHMTATPNDPLTSEKHPSVSTTHWCNLDPLNDKVPKTVSTPNGEKIRILKGS